MPKSKQFSKNPAVLHARIVKLLNVIRAKKAKQLCASKPRNSSSALHS